MKKKLLDMLYRDKINLENYINDSEEIIDYPSPDETIYHNMKLSLLNRQLNKLDKYIARVIEL